nr:transposase, MuDR [Tanacetum cinerariifolium]
MTPKKGNRDLVKKRTPIKSSRLPLLLIGDESKANTSILYNVGNDETRNENYMGMENHEDIDVAKDNYSDMEVSSDSKDSEWIDEEHIMNEVESYDLDDFNSASESDTNLKSRRKKALRKLRKEHEKGGSVDKTTPFYVGKNFPNKGTVRNLVYAHAIATKR